VGAVKLLLDTHTFLWRAVGSSRLSPQAVEALDDRSNSVLVSAASAWEVSTKHRLGKLPEGSAILIRFAQTIRDLEADQLTISVEHSLLAGSFANEHRDPFDRMLAAQAALEGAALVTLDPAFASFPITTLW
jgi:PIN domain nuclease of toxin-antitoxin system